LPLIRHYIFVENEIGSDGYLINKRHYVYFYSMSTAKKNPLKRDQALNDATGGQFGEESSSLPQPDTLDIENGSRKKATRELSRNIE
jgi:hypothetical protein